MVFFLFVETGEALVAGARGRGKVEEGACDRADRVRRGELDELAQVDEVRQVDDGRRRAAAAGEAVVCGARIELDKYY